MNMKFEDDGHCFVCGQNNPAGLKLDFSFDGKTIKTEFIPEKIHQGYTDIVHGGIIATLLDEAMVKVAIELGTFAVTAQMDIRLKKPARTGEKLIISAEIKEEKRNVLFAYAKAETDEGVIVADATGKLVKVRQEAIGDGL